MGATRRILTGLLKTAKEAGRVLENMVSSPPARSLREIAKANSCLKTDVAHLRAHSHFPSFDLTKRQDFDDVSAHELAQYVAYNEPLIGFGGCIGDDRSSAFHKLKEGYFGGKDLVNGKTGLLCSVLFLLKYWSLGLPIRN